nr:MAG: ABC transporter ATP-binding protein [Candidatus Thorarchaeota archaeon SMTZ1-83]
MTEEAIVVNGLTKDFKGFIAVDGVSFQVKMGENFGFLGPNGAGKTTTVKMLCTLLRPSGGNAQVAGYDIVRDQSQVRKSIGIIFQEPSLDDRLTARENLRFHGIIYKVPGKELPARINRSLEWMELEDRADDLVRNFSGGMKRRLEIARGLLHLPKILFLDEPTLGLDPQTRNRIWEYLLRLRQDANVTLFLTTHYMDEAEHCDRIAIIDHGKIIALDTPQELKAQMRGDLVDLQTGDDALTEKELVAKHGIMVRGDSQGLHFEVPNGAEFIPKLVRELTADVIAVSTRRPTLDDVFLKLTGREIRNGSLSGRDRMRNRLQRIGRRWR